MSCMQVRVLAFEDEVCTCKDLFGAGNIITIM